MNGYIRVRGAAEHNLRAIDVDLAHGCLIAVGGVSGSGKTSLVYEVVYAEARRRFLAALDGGGSGGWWRRLRPPRVASIEGLAPALALEQGRTRPNSRSTVATLSGLYDYMRLLYARVGEPHCLACGQAVRSHRFEEVYETALGFAEGTRLLVLAPYRVQEGQTSASFVEWVDRSGYRRLRVGGEDTLLDDLDLGQISIGERIEIVIDRLVVKPEAARRLRGSLQAAIEMGEGQVVLSRRGDHEDQTFAVRPACMACGTPFRPIEPVLFSFNSAQGACPTCRGLGTQSGLSLDRVFAHGALSVENALGRLWQDFGHVVLREKIEAFCRRQKVDVDNPVGDWDSAARQRLWAGVGGRSGFVGVRRWLERIGAKAADRELAWLEERFDDAPCADCAGLRLCPEALAVQVGGVDIGALSNLSIEAACRHIESLQFAGMRAPIGEEVRRHLLQRLRVLDELGLGYLSLGRSAASLSSGEYQRLRLGAALEAGMTQMLYVLDEPSAGLHARDVARLLRALERLRDAGNTVLIVEHERSLVISADCVVDIGPGAGEQGGYLMACGTPAEIARGDSLTAQYLRGGLKLGCQSSRALAGAGRLRLTGARGHNLAIDLLEIPLGNLVGISGVSGSGKSSLINETLYPLLAARLHGAERRPLAYERCEGAEKLQRVVAVDQRPIGRSSRSNAATYTGLLAPIRKLYADLPAARMRAYTASHFSFNAPEGSCDSCGGSGIHSTRQGLYEDIEVVCRSCGGQRYCAEVLDVRFRERHIAAVLEMSVEEARQFFDAIPNVANRLQLLLDVGLGYLRLGQPATSFSGGEAQRVKLAAELGRPRQGDTLYLLDEPTTGLHLEDVRLLLELLQRLVDEGNSVLVTEHHIELLATVDWLIDLGPEAGAAGGRIVAVGTPLQVAANPESRTGSYLRAHFDEGE
jgi:excinuclease ABC subunit A